MILEWAVGLQVAASALWLLFDLHFAKPMRLIGIVTVILIAYIVAGVFLIRAAVAEEGIRVARMEDYVAFVTSVFCSGVGFLAVKVAGKLWQAQMTVTRAMRVFLWLLIAKLGLFSLWAFLTFAVGVCRLCGIRIGDAVLWSAIEHLTLAVPMFGVLMWWWFYERKI